jgi:uncharacterized membrane protein
MTIHFMVLGLCYHHIFDVRCIEGFMYPLPSISSFFIIVSLCVFIFLTPHATSIHKKDVNNRSLLCLPKEFQEAFCPPCSECGM